MLLSTREKIPRNNDENTRFGKVKVVVLLCNEQGGSMPPYRNVAYAPGAFETVLGRVDLIVI